MEREKSLNNEKFGSESAAYQTWGVRENIFNYSYVAVKYWLPLFLPSGASIGKRHWPLKINENTTLPPKKPTQVMSYEQ